MPAIFNTDYQISIWRPYGKISLEFLVDEIKEFTKVEKSYPKFNRFADISECDFSLIKYEDIKQIYMKRKLDYSGPPVLSVFFIKTKGINRK